MLGEIFLFFFTCSTLLVVHYWKKKKKHGVTFENMKNAAVREKLGVICR